MGRGFPGTGRVQPLTSWARGGQGEAWGWPPTLVSSHPPPLLLGGEGWARRQPLGGCTTNLNQPSLQTTHFLVWKINISSVAQLGRKPQTEEKVAAVPRSLLCVLMPPISSTLKPWNWWAQSQTGRAWGKEIKKKKKHNKTTNDQKKEKNNNSLYRIYMITSLTQAEDTRGSGPASAGLGGGAAPLGALPSGWRWLLVTTVTFQKLFTCLLCFLGCEGLALCVCVCVYVSEIFGNTKKWAKKSSTCFYKKQCSREKVLYGSLYTEVGSELQKPISSLRFDFIHAQEKKKKKNPWK